MTLVTHSSVCVKVKTKNDQKLQINQNPKQNTKADLVFQNCFFVTKKPLGKLKVKTDQEQNKNNFLTLVTQSAYGKVKRKIGQKQKTINKTQKHKTKKLNKK